MHCPRPGVGLSHDPALPSCPGRRGEGSVAGSVRPLPRLLHDPGRLDDRLGRDAGDHRATSRRDVNDVVWVTSAYLLAYAVPVLITGRLGDRFGPKKLYMTGLTVFTLASLWCGLTNSVEMLIVARVVQGARRIDDHAADDGDHHPHLPGGAPRAGDGAVGCDGRRRHPGRPDPRRRPGRRARLGVDLLHQRPGRRSSAWSSRRGWCPRCATNTHRFDWLGVALSGAGMFLLVFGIQEGHQYDWSAAIVAMIVVGFATLVLFVLWQARNRAGAAGAARPVPRPQLLAGQRGDRGDGLRDHRDGDPAHALGPGGPRAEPDPLGAAAGADGDHDHRCWPARSARSPTAPTHG